MTNYYVTYTLADKEARDSYYSDIKKLGVGEKSRKENGCIRYEYYFPADEENKLFLWEQWESRDAQKVHTQQPHFAELGQLKEKYSVDVEILVEDQIAEK